MTATAPPLAAPFPWFGYDGEHDELLDRGWTVTAGKSGGGAGYSTRADNGRRERLWCSPACLPDHEQAVLL